MNTQITVDNAIEFAFLDSGSHSDISEGMCAMEMVSFLAHEPFSDSPACACPVIAAYVRRLNDDWSDADRQRLKPYLPKLIGTADPSKTELRSWMALDWMVREYMPAWLELAGINEDAARIRALPPILSAAAAIQAMPSLNSAKEKATAAWDAARDAAWDAARAAAWDAARDAARAAARAAARDAARDAARAKLQPAVDRLQESALKLIDRMVEA